VTGRGEVMIDARQVSKRFLLRHNRSPELKVRVLSWFDRTKREVLDEFWALRDVSFSVRRGEALGLVGRNGSGKSTMLKLIAALHRPTSGQLLVRRDARIGTMIELGVGLHPELTGEENVRMAASIYGFARREIDELYPRIVDYSGLRHFMDVPLKNYSSGMHMRLAFAVAAQIEPDILLLDEIFAVGDAEFRERCLETLDGFRARGRTILFVSHTWSAIEKVCDRVCVLDKGRLRFDGAVADGLAFYEDLTARPDSVVRDDGAAVARP
jgi:ABC-type polysaccharide/polyol phosphate transport system ATPase subunit